MIMLRPVAIICVVALLCNWAVLSFANNTDGDLDHHTVVLAHGSTRGAWDWKEVADLLNDAKPDVYRAKTVEFSEMLIDNVQDKNK